MSVRLGIIGSGSMGASHARAFTKQSGVQVVVACDIREEQARAFASEHDIPSWSSNAEEVFARNDVDAVSIVTPDRTHAALSIAALEAGKHVLCEKPLSVDAISAREMASVARGSGKVNMVNFSYRRSAALEEARRLVASGALGTIRHLDARYFQSWLVSDAWGNWRSDQTWLWRLSREHGSMGVLGDIGVHMLDFVTTPVGPLTSLSCALEVFEKAPDNRIDEYQLDANDSAIVTMWFEGRAIGVLQLSRWTTGHLNTIQLSLHGDLGAVRMELDKGFDRLEVCMGDDVRDAVWRTRELDPRPSVYEDFIRAIRTGSQGSPDFARGAQVQGWLDACFASAHSGDRIDV